MSENTLEVQLKTLKCHFTWNLQAKQGDDISIEEKVNSQMEFLATDNQYMVYNLMAYIKYVQGDHTEAMAMLKEAEKRCPSNSNQSDAKLLVIYGNYAWLYYTLEDYDKSRLYVKKVESISKELQQSTDPNLNCPEIYGEQGWSFLQYSRNYYEQAKECFQKALEHTPEDPEWNTGYATVVYRLETLPDGKYPGHHSLDLLKRAIELNPRDSVMKTLLGLKLQELKREDEGLKYIEAALEQTPNLPYVLRYVATFYRRAEMIDEALLVLRRAKGLQPNSAFILHQLGQCYRSKMIAYKKSVTPGNQNRQAEIDELIQNAIDYFKLSLEYEESFKHAYVDLANMYSETKEYEKAEELFKKVLTFDCLTGDEKQSILLNYGRFAWYHKKSDMEAIEHYKAALLIPGRCTDSKKCEMLLEKTAKMLYKQHNYSLAFGLLGLVYKVQGNNTESIRYYEKALALDSTNEEYTRALSELRNQNMEQ